MNEDNCVEFGLKNGQVHSIQSEDVKESHKNDITPNILYFEGFLHFCGSCRLFFGLDTILGHCVRSHCAVNQFIDALILGEIQHKIDHKIHTQFGN